jgi:hypothetical protein
MRKCVARGEFGEETLWPSAERELDALNVSGRSLIDCRASAQGCAFADRANDEAAGSASFVGATGPPVPWLDEQRANQRKAAWRSRFCETVVAAGGARVCVAHGVLCLPQRHAGATGFERRPCADRANPPVFPGLTRRSSPLPQSEASHQ